MKAISITIKILVVLWAILLSIICASDLINFLQYPESYFIGSEAMIGNGGWSYRTNFTFIFFNSIMIIFSILLSFFALKSRKIKVLLLILLLAICQTGCLIIL